jgi:hypothetical protein
MDIRFSDVLDDALTRAAATALLRPRLRRIRWQALVVLLLGLGLLLAVPPLAHRSCLREMRMMPGYGRPRQIRLTDEWLEVVTEESLSRVAWGAFGKVDEAGGVLLLRYGPTVVPINLGALAEPDRTPLREFLAARTAVPA